MAIFRFMLLLFACVYSLQNKAFFDNNI